jgi:hypothetical protein
MEQRLQQEVLKMKARISFIKMENILNNSPGRKRERAGHDGAEIFQASQVSGQGYRNG